MTERERELYDSIDDEAKAHPLMRDERGVLRFECRLPPGTDRGQAINEANERRCRGEYSEARFRQFYRDLGYSLGGYCELIDQDAI